MSSVLLRLSVALAATLPLFVSASQAQPTEEYAVKAAFLYNFARFTEWPADSFASDSAPFVLCIVGRDPFGQALEAVEGRSVKGHAVRIDRRPAADKLRDCHIAFISQSERSRVRTVLKSAENDPVLTVSDID